MLDDIETLNRNNNSNNNNTFTNKTKGQWPHWCVYLGWALVFVLIFISAIFTILYSMQWGKVKSADWLTAFLLSFTESALLIQPVKVQLP